MANENLKKWATGAKQSAEAEEPPEEEMQEGAEDAQEPSPEAEEIAGLVRNFLPQIEENIAQLDPDALVNLDEELSEEDTQTISSLLEEFSADEGGDGEHLMQELPDIEPEMCLEIAQVLEDDVQETDPGMLAIWLYRAGQLV